MNNTLRKRVSCPTIKPTSSLVASSFSLSSSVIDGNFLSLSFVVVIPFFVKELVNLLRVQLDGGILLVASALVVVVV